MANNDIQFSAMFDVGSAANVERAMEMSAEYINPDTDDRGFAIQRQGDYDSGSTALWIWADECGDVESVAQFVADVGKALDLTGMWGMTWAETCSRPRINEFGGGAVAVNLTTGRISYMNARGWLDHELSKRPKRKRAA